ncbi:MAG: enoyl-CoA hydratase/isomerase family protein [Sandaracinaceae bacterium]|nr:enoyl-CoA hydratase/isomerase family protein [Sandaracinaceae bacterium]
MPELDLGIRGRVARLTLNRPSARNALSPSLLRALVDACASLRGDEEVRVVVLRGAAGTFSAGADLVGFMSELGSSDPESVADLGRRAAEALAGLPQITVRGHRGPLRGRRRRPRRGVRPPLGYDRELLLHPRARAGIPLAWGGLERLVQLLGESVAADLVITCRRFGVDEALRYGLVSAVLDGALDEAVDARIEAVASRAAGALRTTKRQLSAIRAGDFDAAADAGALLAALSDPESQRAAQDYIARRVRSKKS